MSKKSNKTGLKLNDILKTSAYNGTNIEESNTEKGKENQDRIH
jgi:hypothetical protein